MGQQYLLGLDNGGTVTQAALYGTHGEEIAVAGAQVKPIMEKVGFVERDARIRIHRKDIRWW